MRKLASIQTVLELNPIEGADRIETAKICGWVAVVKKGEFKVGDKVVYIEIDAILPERPEFEFMRERKFRVKSVRLRKQLSQGLVFPLSILPNKKWAVGDDVTDVIGIKLHDPEGDREREAEELRKSIQKSRMQKFFMRYSWFRRMFKPTLHRGFPSFVSKTDETRIQAFPEVLDTYRYKHFYVTEKVDGSSMTVYLIKGRWFTKLFGVCSRNLSLGRDNSNFWKCVIKYDMEAKLRKARKELGVDLVLQGELLGPGVQGNKYGLKELNYLIFNIWDPVTGTFFPLESMEEFCARYGFTMVPLIKDSMELDTTLDELLDFAKGKSVLADIPREGIVLRDRNAVGRERMSFKVINNDFLLKYDL